MVQTTVKCRLSEFAASVQTEANAAFNPLTFLYFMVPLIVGITAGYLLRNKKQVKLEKASLAVIVVLIFALGFGIGSNNELLSAMPQVGLQAFVIAGLAILFSILFIMAGKRLVKL